MLRFDRAPTTGRPLAAMLALAGCAGMSEQACLTSDWRTVGFEDGSLGRSEATIGNYRKAVRGARRIAGPRGVSLGACRRRSDLLQTR